MTMSDEEFEKQKTGLITRLLEKPKTLGGRFRRFWNEIDCRQYDFDRSEFVGFILAVHLIFRCRHIIFVFNEL